MDDEPFDPAAILGALERHGVDYVVIGGLAGLAHGSLLATHDVDVAYRRSAENHARLAAALRDLGATLRGAPPGLPFMLDAETLAAGANFTFTTRHGALDVLGDPAGAPRFDELAARSSNVDLAGLAVRIASIDDLIAMKQAAGRPKDRLMASELKVISDELRAPRDPVDGGSDRDPRPELPGADGGPPRC